MHDEYEKPLVSIGIPTYNRSFELERILHQMVSQTYENIEIIILDNSSTDTNVQLVAEEFSEKYSNIKYIRNKENIGVLRNAPELIKYANGKYFCWVSDDDYRSTDFIERTVNYLENFNDVSCVFCDYGEVDIKGNQQQGYPLNHSKLMWFFSLRSRCLRRMLYYISSSSCGKCNAFYGLFRIELLKSINFSEISNSYTALDMDCMLVYQTLALTRIPILEFQGCFLTVGNAKEYQVSSNSNTQNFMKKIQKVFIRLHDERRRYISFSNTGEVILITLLFPIKIVTQIIIFALGRKCLSPFAQCGNNSKKI